MRLVIYIQAEVYFTINQQIKSKTKIKQGEGKSDIKI